ncbi:MAG TPA: four helix bundle protein [Pyrinomonadaceae bacterium]|nr:four helix bundle protein [Pyrinomonadaceae bacterium]
MAKTSFENLEVYQLAERLSDTIWRIAASWEYFAKCTLGTQIVRSADSISANIAEGCGRFNYKDNAKFIRIARGSLYETKNWLRRAFQRGLLTEGQIDELKPIIDELLPRLNAYLASIKRAGETINN